MQIIRTYTQKQGKDTVVAVVFAGEEEGEVSLWLCCGPNQMVEIEKKLEEYCTDMGQTLTLSQAQVPGTMLYDIVSNGNKNCLRHDFLVETDGLFKE